MLFELPVRPLFFFFNDTATTEIYTLSLHDALPIYLIDSFLTIAELEIAPQPAPLTDLASRSVGRKLREASATLDRKSTRLNSSHLVISYAVFCLKKKKCNLDASR